MTATGRTIGLLFAFSLLAAAHDIPVTTAERGLYGPAKQGGNYMHNYYLPPAPSSTPWAPAWSPDGKTIAVAMQGSVWSVDPETGNATELTYNGRYHSSPAWSPDGKWLVYTADDDNETIQLEALNVATGETHALTDEPQLFLDPTFSPDGSKLAYVSTKPNGNFNVYVRAIKDGQWAGEEIAVTKDNKFPRSRLYFGEWDIHIEPEWTNDGESLFIVSNQGIPLGSGGVWLVPAKANGMADAKMVFDEQTLYRTRPDISVDGKRFIFSSMSGGADQFHHLYVLPTAGGYPYKMTFGDHDDFHPRWSPDGESIAYISNQGGLPQLVVMETYGGKKNRVSIKQRKWKRPMGSLEVSVVDSKGKPLYGRIHGLASDGKFYAPTDAYSRIAPSTGHIFHMNGDYTVEVPVGKMTVAASHGFEYMPKSVEVDIKEGKTAKLKIALSEMADLNAKGWYSGSTHVHMNYGGNLRNTLENLILMSKAEDQDVVNELVANKDNRILDWQYFVEGGGEHPITTNDPKLALLVGEEYRPPFYGHMFFIGLRDHLISPFLTGYEGTGVESLYPSNTDMLRKAAAQGAVSGYVHPFFGEADPVASGTLGGAKGFAVDAVLGTVQCLEWSGASRVGHSVWMNALNNDLRVTPTGGEDSISNLHVSKLVGSVRTYAYMGKDFSVSAWKQALEDGKTFFTTGPLLEFDIDGKIPGEDVQLKSAGGTAHFKASVRSITPIAKAVIYRDGEIFKTLTISEDHMSASLDEQIPVTSSAWYALYVEGPNSEWLDAEFAQAGTNAVRVYVGDQKIRNEKSADYFVKWIDRLQTLASEWLWWRSDAEKDHVFAQFDEARELYVQLREEASAKR